MDIFCKNKICPICGSKMNSYVDSPISNKNGTAVRIMEITQCNNNCFMYEHNIAQGGANVEFFYVFHEQYPVPMFRDKHERQPYYSKVMKEVKYWKENDRYLMQILTS